MKNVYKAVQDRKDARVGFLIYSFIIVLFKAAGEIGEESSDFIDFFLNAESETVEKEITGVYDKSNVHVSFLILYLL